MRKTKILCFLLCIAILFSVPLGGCKKASGGGKSLRLWFSSYASENEELREIAKNFYDDTGITVEVLDSNFFDITSRFTNSAETSERPDIIYIQNSDLGTLAESDYLQPLDFIDNEIITRFDEIAVNGFRYNGEIYGIGYSIDSYGILYNKGLVSEVPKTWEEYFDLASSLTLKDGEGKITQYGTLINPRSFWFIEPILRKFGGYYMKCNEYGEFDPSDIGIDSAGMLEGINYIKSLRERGFLLETRNQTESDIINEMLNGRLAMCIYGLWNAEMLKNKGIDYGLAVLPDNSKGLSTVQGFVINKYSQNMDAAKQFYSYIYKDENQQRLYEAANGNELKSGQRNTCNLSVAASDYVTSNEILLSYYKLGKNGEIYPTIPEGTLLSNYGTSTFTSIFYPREGDKDAKTLLLDLAARLRADMRIIQENRENKGGSSDMLVIIMVAVILLLFILFAVYITLKMVKAKNNQTRKKIIMPFLMLLPFFILLFIFYLFPIFHNLYISLTNYSNLHLRNFSFTGLDNYFNIFSTGINGFLSMLLWTLVYAGCVVLLSFLFGLLLAVVLDRTGIKVSKIFRIIYILPWVVPTAITILMWQGLLQEGANGLINQILSVFNLPAVSWLSDRNLARVCTIFVMTWLSFPYFMIVAQGMIKAIPKSYYEAAELDGATAFFSFKKITLPLVVKSILPVLIMGFILQFNQFGVYLLTAGGPAADTLGQPGATDLLITYVFNTAFNTRMYSLAAAYSVIIFIFVALFALLSLRAGKKIGREE